MIKSIWITVLVFIAAIGAHAHKSPVDDISNQPIRIIENKGQWDAKVLFRAAVPGGNMFITSTGFAYAFYDEKAVFNITHGYADNDLIKGHNYFVDFLGSNPYPAVEKHEPASVQYHFFSGPQSRWASGCRAYGKIVLKNIYNGIDLEILAKDESIKLNFIVRPFANPNLVKMKYRGIDGINIVNGAIEVSTSVSFTKEEKPFSYQPENGIEKEVYSEYRLDGQTVSFYLEPYDQGRPLVIDPNLIFSTFSGSVADNFGYTATYDEEGHGYSGGTVYSPGFPVTPGAYQVFYNGVANGVMTDAGILKYTPDGKSLLYCTYLGGSHIDQPHSMVCNANGELYIMGTTRSADFPVTSNAFDPSHNGNFDMFIAKLSADGSSLLASTFVGGSMNDGINGNSEIHNYDPATGPLAYNYGDHYRGEIIEDGHGGVYIASATQSSGSDGFPVINAFQPVFGGKQDGCIFQLNGNLDIMGFSSFIGGSDHDAAYGLAVDSSHQIFVTGGTASTNFGPTSGPFKHHGNVDAFIARLNPSGTILEKIIMMGTSSYDQSFLIQLDNAQNVYITGQTTSGNFPVKGSVYRINQAKQFLTIFDNDLLDYTISTTFGSKTNSVYPNISPTALLVDVCNRVYISGWGGSVNINYNQGTGSTATMPVSANAFQSTTDGSDFYIIVFSPDIARIAYATFMGSNRPGAGEHVDGGTSRFDKRAVIYQSACAGCGGFSDFPTTPGAWSRTNKGKRPGSSRGGCNNALFKMDMDVSVFPPALKPDTLIAFTASQNATYNFSIYDPDGDSVSMTSTSPILTRPDNPAKLTYIKGSNWINATLKWNPSCSDANDTVEIMIESWDNGCPVKMYSTSRIRISVLSPVAPESPYPSCLKPLNDSSLLLNWIYPSAGNVEHIFLLKRTNEGSFGILDSFPGTTTKSLMDQKSQQHLINNYCYVLIAKNICGIPSDSSRMICSVFKEDTNSVPGFFFPKDTTFYIIATDTGHFEYSITDSDHRDSVFTQLSGNILADSGLISLNRQDSLAKAMVKLNFTGSCNDLDRNDTLKLNVYIQDNQCPHPRNASGTIRIITLPPPGGPGPTLRCVKAQSPHHAEVRWKNPQVNKYFDHFVLVKKFEDGRIEKLTDIPHSSSHSYLDKKAADHQKTNYCYALYPVNICGIAGDTGEYSCTIRPPEAFPSDLAFYTVTVSENKRIRLFIRSGPDPADEFAYYNIYKRINEENEKHVWYRSITSQADSVLTDDSVQVQNRSYCYTVRQVNDCALESRNADEACSILLRAKGLPFEHQLEWNQYHYWADGTRNYSILKQENDLEVYQASAVANKYDRFIDDRLNPENGIFRYTVVANEGNGGFGYTSVSNTVELIQAPHMYVPNAFTPNGDGINDDFNLRPVFVKDFTLQIYDRWGKLIFRTNDKHETFKGEFLDDPSPSDVFVYMITYTGWDGSSHSMKGNFTILK